jgi:hypothetical protein
MPAWSDLYIVRIYELARSGLSMKETAAALGVQYETLRGWYRGKPAVRDAVERARAGRAPGGTGGAERFFEYVYRRLPPDLQDLWDQIEEADKEPNPVRRLESLMADRGVRARQHLWMHAFVSSCFNTSEACRKLNVTVDVVDAWKKDPAFLRLIGQVMEMKKDFVEGGLLTLIADGDTQATIFAARTLLRERGYDPKVTVVHQGGVLHGHVDIDDLALDADTKRKMLAAMRNGNAPPPAALEPARRVTVEADDED